MVSRTLGGRTLPANGSGRSCTSMPLSVSIRTILQYCFSAFNCASVFSTNPWNMNGVSVHGRSSSWMYTPNLSWETETCFFGMARVPRRPGRRAAETVGRSEFENVVVLQQARRRSRGKLLDLLHGQLDLRGLQVRDVDLRGALELGELLAQHGRAQVLGQLGEPAVLVRERRLDDQELEVLDAVHRGPQGVVGAGVAGEYQASLAAVEEVADGGNGVQRRQHRDPAP